MKAVWISWSIRPRQSQRLSVASYLHPIHSLHSMNAASVPKNRISFAKENVVFPSRNTIALCPERPRDLFAASVL